jgi:hypothetical protein
MEIKDHLLPDGVVAINVGRTNTDRRLIDAMTATLLEVYPSVHAIDVQGSFNTILVATMQFTNSDNLIENLNLLPDNAEPILRTVLTKSVATLAPVVASYTLFTDDRAPVETLVDALVINFLLNGNIDEIR